MLASDRGGTLERGKKGAIGKTTQVTMCVYQSQVFGKNGVPGDIAQRRESKSLVL